MKIDMSYIINVVSIFAVLFIILLVAWIVFPSKEWTVKCYDISNVTSFKAFYNLTDYTTGVELNESLRVTFFEDNNSIVKYEYENRIVSNGWLSGNGNIYEMRCPE